MLKSLKTQIQNVQNNSLNITSKIIITKNEKMIYKYHIVVKIKFFNQYSSKEN